MAGGRATLAALGGDLTLAGSGVTAGTDALLQAKGNVALQAVTDHRYDYTRTVSHGFLSKKTITQSKDTTDEIGGLIAANNDIAVAAGGDLSIAGAIDGKRNVALSSGGNLMVTALKNTEDTYYQKKKSGLIASLKGGSFSFGVGRSQNTDTGNGVTWTPSDLRAENGNLLLTSKGNTLVKGSTLSAGQNLQINGSSVTLDDAVNTLTQTQKSQSSFLGVTAGITSSSAAGKALSGKKKDPSSQGQPSISLLRTESALDVAGEQGKGLGDYMPGNVSQVLSQFGVNGNALTVQANMGFSKVKSFAQQTTHTVQGDSLNAGNTVSIIARGDNPQDGTSGAIKAVSAQINAQNIALEAQKNIKLQSDWNTLSAFSKTHSSGVSAGVSFGTSSIGPDVSVDNTRQNATKESGTAVNTSLNAQQNIALDAGHGGVTLAGADLHAGQSAVLQSKGDITLQAVTNYQSSTYNSTNHGLFTKQKDIDDNASTNETGNTIAAQNDVALSSGGNVALAGSLTGGRNVSVTAAGNVNVNALKTTAHSFKEHKTSGLTSSSENGQSKLGYGKSDDQSTVDATDWQGSLLQAAQHDLTIHSGGATTITSSSLSAGHDLGIDASSVAFKALEDTLTQQQLHKSLFIGLTAGLSPNSIAGQALQSVLGALQSSGKGSTLLRSLYAMQGAEAVGSGIYKDQTAKVSYYPRNPPKKETDVSSDTPSDSSKAGASSAAGKDGDDDSDKSGAGGNLIGVQVNVEFDKSKQTSTQTTQTVQGSQASAGNDVSIIARGDGAHDQTKGDIDLAATQVLGRNIALDAAHNLTVKAGWNRSDSEMRSRQSSGSIGVDVSVGTQGWGASVEGSMQLQK